MKFEEITSGEKERVLFVKVLGLVEALETLFSNLENAVPLYSLDDQELVNFSDKALQIIDMSGVELVVLLAEEQELICTIFV